MKAHKYIEQIDAEMGGTNILPPLAHAIDKIAPNATECRIFLLTDGQVSNRSAICKKANTNSERIRIHTFGIGDDCDKTLV